MRVGCVLIQMHEVNALEPWLLYHARLFGMDNLCVIDQGSTDLPVTNTPDWYEKEGLKVVRPPDNLCRACGAPAAVQPLPLTGLRQGEA